MQLRKLKNQWPFHLMVLPGVIMVFIFSYIPLYGIVIAFQRFHPVKVFNSPWVGLDNFRYVFSLQGFTRTIRNTLSISAMKIIAGIVVPVAFALMLNEISSVKFKRTFQTLIYAPHFLSWIIISGMMIDILSTDGGVINAILGIFGIEPIFFLGDNSWFPVTMVITDVWKNFGYGTIVYLAALTNIDPGLYEAAMVDGAKRWKQTIHITLPGISSIVILMTVLSLGSVLNAGFDQIFNMYNPSVYETGDIIDTFVYRLGMQQAQYSQAAAVGLFKSVVSAFLIGTSYFLADRVAGYRIF